MLKLTRDWLKFNVTQDGREHRLVADIPIVPIKSKQKN